MGSPWEEFKGKDSGPWNDFSSGVDSAIATQDEELYAQMHPPSAAQTAVDSFTNKALSEYQPQLEGAARVGMAQFTGAGLPGQPAKPSYVGERDSVDARIKAGAAANPGVAMPAGILGTGLNALATGGLLKKAGLAKELASPVGRILRGGFVGGSVSALQNPGDTPGVVDPLQLGARATNFGYGAALGGGMSAAAESAALRKWALKKTLNTGFDVPESASEAYLTDRDAVNNARSKQGMAQKIADTFGEVRADSGPAHEQAMSALSTQREVAPGMEAQTAINLLNDVDSPTAKNLAARLRTDYSGQINPADTFISERDLKEVHQTLKAIGDDYRSAIPTADIGKARAAAGNVNAGLKGRNPEYGRAMEDVAGNTSVKHELAQRFGIENTWGPNAPESGFKPTDKTLTAIDDVSRGKKMDRQAVLDTLKSQGYGNLSNDIQNTAAKQVLYGGGHPNGYRKAGAFGTMGAAAGATVGGPIGAAIGSGVGAGVGFAADKYGPQMGRKIMDASIAMRPMTGLTTKAAQSPYAQSAAGQLASQNTGFDKNVVMQKLQNTPYAQQLGSAKNDHDYALRYYELNKNPEFRKIIGSDGSGQ